MATPIPARTQPPYRPSPTIAGSAPGRRGPITPHAVQPTTGAESSRCRPAQRDRVEPPVGEHERDPQLRSGQPIGERSHELPRGAAGHERLTCDRLRHRHHYSAENLPRLRRCRFDKAMEKTCSSCGQAFRPAFVFQIAVTADGEPSHFCSLECRTARLGAEGYRGKRARRIAILNQKGGTGKTTTAVNLAAGLAERENDCLLIDTDAQGNVGVSLGVAGEQSLYHVHRRRRRSERRQRAGPPAPRRDHIGLDAGRRRDLAGAPTSGAALEDHDQAPESHAGIAALRLRDHRLRAVAQPAQSECAVLRRRSDHSGDMRLPGAGRREAGACGRSRTSSATSATPSGCRAVLPTFYDGRTRLAREVLETLQGHFKHKCLEPIRPQHPARRGAEPQEDDLRVRAGRRTAPPITAGSVTGCCTTTAQVESTRRPEPGAPVAAPTRVAPSFEAPEVSEVP